VALLFWNLLAFLLLFVAAHLFWDLGEMVDGGYAGDDDNYDDDDDDAGDDDDDEDFELG